MIQDGQYVAFVGELGAGKTLNMCRVGAGEALEGRASFANFRTFFATEIESIPHLFSIRSGVLMLDELQSLLDSRDFKKNMDITQWCLIVRKLGLTVLYTTQDFGQVDVRVRNITGWIYFCEPATWGGGKATKIELVRQRHGMGKLVRKFIVPHSPALYALYDTKDIRVKLTGSGRVASFDAAAMATG